MFKNKKKIDKIYKLLNNISNEMTKSNILDFTEIMGDWKALIKRNFISGIFKGIGIGIGVTLISAVIVYVLQKIIKLNIPVISEYIADIINIVEKNK